MWQVVDNFDRMKDLIFDWLDDCKTHWPACLTVQLAVR